MITKRTAPSTIKSPPNRLEDKPKSAEAKQSPSDPPANTDTLHKAFLRLNTCYCRHFRLHRRPHADPKNYTRGRNTLQMVVLPPSEKSGAYQDSADCYYYYWSEFIMSASPFAVDSPCAILEKEKAPDNSALDQPNS